MPRRGSIRVPHTFDERLAAEKSRLEAQAAKLRPGPQKDELLHKIAQLETAPELTTG